MTQKNIKSYICKNLLKVKKELYYVKPEEFNFENIIVTFKKTDVIVKKINHGNTPSYYCYLYLTYKYPDGKIKPLRIKTVCVQSENGYVTDNELNNIIFQIEDVVKKYLEKELPNVKLSPHSAIFDNRLKIKYDKNLDIIQLHTNKMREKTNKKFEIITLSELPKYHFNKKSYVAKYILSATMSCFLISSPTNNEQLEIIDTLSFFHNYTVDIMEIKHKMSTTASLIDENETIYSSSYDICDTNGKTEIFL